VLKPIILLCALAVGVVQAFADLDESYYPWAITALAEAGLISGYPDGTFRPKAQLSRAEFVSLIARGQGLEAAPASCFQDVPAQAWYAAAVCAAKAAGFVEGYDDGSFRPKENVRYAEALGIALRAAGLPQNQSASPWYAPYVARAHETSIASKYGYLPDMMLRREEMASLLYRMSLPEGERGLSPGCGRPPPEAPPSSLELFDQTRHFILYVPEDYSENTPKKLVFAFHGRTNTNEQVRGYYRLEQHDQNEAVIVYPSALRQADGTFSWADPGDPADRLRDYALFDALLAELAGLYCLDLDHVYLVGHSLGAWFASSLACARAELVRGLAAVAGGVSPSDCRAPVAALLLHNPEDEHVAFAQGLAVRDLFLEKNRCGPSAVPVSPERLNCQRYTGCVNDNAVVWCPHEEHFDFRGEYYPHLWPRDTAEAIWAFFRTLD
jgi:polyhydroxybutyrate depolymerase